MCVNVIFLSTLSVNIFLCTSYNLAFALQLMDTNAQLWYIIREYICNSEVALTWTPMSSRYW